MVQKKTGKKIFPFANQPLLFGHRGCSKIAPENTLAAFRGILDNNIPGAELDVHTCKSGELVVTHDFNLERITGINTLVEDTTYKELCRMDFGAFFSKEYEGEKIPTLDEVFTLMGDRVYYDIEIKHAMIKSGTMETEIMSKIREYNLQDRVIISSFNPFAVRKFRKLFPDIPTAVIYSNSRKVPFVFRRGAGKYIAGPDILKPSKKQVAQKLLKHTKRKQKYGVMTWVVDNVDTASDLLARGVDGIISNQPEVLKETVSEFY